MNDFLKGFSNETFGQNAGQPSQSVLEAMGRDAARQQHNPSTSYSAGGYSYRHSGGGESLFNVIRNARLSGKKILRDLAISFGISFVLIILSAFAIRLGVITTVLSIVMNVLFFWAVLRGIVFLLSKLFRVIKPDQTPSP